MHLNILIAFNYIYLLYHISFNVVSKKKKKKTKIINDKMNMNIEIIMLYYY